MCKHFNHTPVYSRHSFPSLVSITHTRAIPSHLFRTYDDHSFLLTWTVQGFSPSSRYSFLCMPASTRKNELWKRRRKPWNVIILVSSPTHNNSFRSQPSNYVGRYVDRYIGRGVHKIHMVPNSFGCFENLRKDFGFKLTPKKKKFYPRRRNSSSPVKG